MDEESICVSPDVWRRLKEVAETLGISIDQLVSEAFNEAFEWRYLLPSSGGLVIPFEALKSPKPD